MKAIELTRVGKRYRQYESEPLLINRLLRPHRRRAKRELWALRDVSFVAERGETVGVIGRNGSGKTTLLRLLSGVSAPSEGRLRVVGAIAPLIGIGVGFNQELTGRENVLVNGRLLGLSAEQLRARFDEIVAFSEIEAFIDTPVKYYSSGMFLRLAFAIAIHTDPEIFLLDELLAVGDVAFQVKCHEKMREIQDSGATIVVVTHSMQVLNRLAPRAIVLDRGQVAFDGPVEAALGVYHDIMQRDQRGHFGSEQLREAMLLEEGNEAWWAGAARVTVELTDEDGGRTRAFESGGAIHVGVHAELDEEVQDPLIGAVVKAVDGGGVFTTFTMPGEYGEDHGPGRPMDARITLRNRLLQGSYAVRVEVRDRENRLIYGASDWELFSVTSHARARGLVNLEPVIEIGGRSLATEAPRLGERPDVPPRRDPGS